jgi:hypothetical protein
MGEGRAKRRPEIQNQRGGGPWCGVDYKTHLSHLMATFLLYLHCFSWKPKSKYMRQHGLRRCLPLLQKHRVIRHVLRWCLLFLKSLTFTLDLELVSVFYKPHIYGLMFLNPLSSPPIPNPTCKEDMWRHCAVHFSKFGAPGSMTVAPGETRSTLLLKQYKRTLTAHSNLLSFTPLLCL